MRNTEIRKALSLLKEARQLLGRSNVANLRRSAGYLDESMQVLKQRVD